MEIKVRTFENGCAIINGKILVDSDLSISEMQHLVEEYDKLGTSVAVYTPGAMDNKWGAPGFLERNIENLDVGGTIGFMSETIVKISQHFCILKDENVIQMSDLRKAV